MISLRVIILHLCFAINFNSVFANGNTWAILMTGYDYYEFTYAFEVGAQRYVAGYNS